MLPLLLALAAACHSTAVFEAYQDIPKEVWSRYQPVEFAVNLPDSGQYQIYICLRHTADYEMANLWCFISTRSRQAPFRDTVNLKIAEPDGRWIGKGGSVKTLEQPIRLHPVRLPAGKLTFRIEQGMRFENMNGIKNVGIRIERKEEEDTRRGDGAS